MNYIRTKTLLILLTVVATISMILCTAISTKSDEKQLLPEQFSDGFKLTKPVAFYDPGNLFELINGQAVFYLSYGFVRLEHAFYEKEPMKASDFIARYRKTLGRLAKF